MRFGKALEADPRYALAHAGISDTVVFVGLGHKFQIWEPQAFGAHLEEARAKVRDLKRGLGARSLERLTPQAIPPGAREP